MIPSKFAALVPYLPAVISCVGCSCVAFTLGYVFRSWMGRAQPSQFLVAARVFIGAPVMVLWIVSVVFGMFNQGYSTPMALNAAAGTIIFTLFPKKIFRLGKNGYEFGLAAPQDKAEIPHDDHDDDDDQKP